MLLELDKCNVQIMRHDQQLNQLDIINVKELYNIILNFMKYNNKDYNFKHKP